MFRQGDIVGIRGKLIERMLNMLIEPVSDLWHLFIIGEEVSKDDDYVIYEMMGDGCRTGRLSMYEGQPVKVYRCPDRQIARRAAQEASHYGRYPYDYPLFARLFFRALYYWVYNGFRPVPFKYFDNVENNQLICIELVANCYYNAGYPLVSDGIVPTPAAIEQAAKDKRLNMVYEGLL